MTKTLLTTTALAVALVAGSWAPLAHATPKSTATADANAVALAVAAVLAVQKQQQKQEATLNGGTQSVNVEGDDKPDRSASSAIGGHVGAAGGGHYQCLVPVSVGGSIPTVSVSLGTGARDADCVRFQIIALLDPADPIRLALLRQIPEFQAAERATVAPAALVARQGEAPIAAAWEIKPSSDTRAVFNGFGRHND